MLLVSMFRSIIEKIVPGPLSYSVGSSWMFHEQSTWSCAVRSISFVNELSQKNCSVRYCICIPHCI